MLKGGREKVLDEMDLSSDSPVLQVSGRVTVGEIY